LRICKVKDSPGRNHSTDIVAVRAADCNQSTVMAGQMAHQAISMHRPGSLNRVDAQDNIATRQEIPNFCTATARQYRFNPGNRDF
jgi:hypothetical protein